MDPPGCFWPPRLAGLRPAQSREISANRVIRSSPASGRVCLLRRRGWRAVGRRGARRLELSDPVGLVPVDEGEAGTYAVVSSPRLGSECGKRLRVFGEKDAMRTLGLSASAVHRVRRAFQPRRWVGAFFRECVFLAPPRRPQRTVHRGFSLSSGGEGAGDGSRVYVARSNTPGRDFGK